MNITGLTKHIFILLLSGVLASTTMTSCGSSKNTSKKKKAATTAAIPVLSAREERQFSYYFHEAIREREKGNYDVALEFFVKCYHINDQNPPLLYEFASLYASIGEIDYAISYLTTAAALDDENAWYKVNLANLYLAAGDVRTATEIYEYATNKFPDKIDFCYTLAELYLKQRRYDEAIAALNKIESKQGISQEISFEKFRIYSNLGEQKKAEKEIDALINRFPGEMRYRVMRGNIYFENNDPKRALELYNYVLEQEPDNGYARLSLAEFYQKTGEKDKSTAEMYYALSSKNIDVETKISMLDTYLNVLKDKEEWEKRAPELFETLVEIHPNIIDIRQYYAMYLMAVDRIEDAKKEYQTILDIDPNDIQAWLGIVEISIREEKAEDIIDATNQAIKVAPQLPGWYLYQGLAYTQLKKPEEAIAAYQKGIELIPEYENKLKSDFHGQMADVYFEMNDKENAFQHYEEAVKNNHLNVHVLNNYSYYLSIEKRDLDKAEKMIKECVRLSPNNATFLDTYAWVLFQQGFYNLAKRQIEEAMKYGGDSSDVILEHYGDILSKTGNTEEAIEMWKKSLSMGNTSETLPLKIEKGEYIE